jgi:hypothetical protein
MNDEKTTSHMLADLLIAVIGVATLTLLFLGYLE